MGKDYLRYWSLETNPETGGRFENARCSLEGGSNGHADINALIDSPFGEELTQRFLDRIRFEKDPMGQECLDYYKALNLKKELHDDEDYYKSWLSFIPLDAFTLEGSAKKYPLIICNVSDNGGCYDIGFHKLAGKERFIYVIPKNTNWENVSLLTEKICAMYPVDRERIYLMGFSYGGYQATAAMFRVPWKFAAVAPCANDVYREWDNWRIPYTDGEVETLRHVLVPVVQYVGQQEASNFVPLNDWKPRSHESYPRRGIPDIRDPREDRRKDPTICPQRHLPNGDVIPTPVSMMPHPKPGEDPRLWQLDKLNKRMYSLGCTPRDVETCLSYANTPEDELHHVLGFYGDEEHIEYVNGHKHWVCNVNNAKGLNVYRYIVWENGVHSFPICLGDMVWAFFKKFRRDTATGKIVEDEYQYQA